MKHTKKRLSVIGIVSIVVLLFLVNSKDAEIEVQPTIPTFTESVLSLNNTESDSVETEATKCTLEQIPIVVEEVPLYNQLDYAAVRYGNYGTIKSHGCGITCLAMVSTYLLDDPTLTPDVLAEQFGEYNTSCGSSWSLFIDSAEILGLGEVKQVQDWNIGEVEQALRDGSLVISNQRGGVFTNSGHYILLTGITEDGKVMVHDPNGANWERGFLVDKFENGFEYKYVSRTSSAYWIYTPKNS